MYQHPITPQHVYPLTRLASSTVAQGYVNNPRVRADTSLTITPCGDGSYCCGPSIKAQNYCSNRNGYFIIDKSEAVRKGPSISISAIFTPRGTSTATSSGTLEPATSSKPAIRHKHSGNSNTQENQHWRDCWRCSWKCRCAGISWGWGLYVLEKKKAKSDSRSECA